MCLSNMRILTIVVNTPVTKPTDLTTLLECLSSHPDLFEVHVLESGSSLRERSIARSKFLEDYSGSCDYVYMPDAVDVIDMDSFKAALSGFKESDSDMVILKSLRTKNGKTEEFYGCKHVVKIDIAREVSPDTLGVGKMPIEYAKAVKDSSKHHYSQEVCYSWEYPTHLASDLMGSK